jgi:hypothetical protein
MGFAEELQPEPSNEGDLKVRDQRGRDEGL